MNFTRTKDLHGMQFGLWTVIEFHGYDKNKDAEWICKCSCGTEKPVKATYLLRGTSSKCKKCAIPKRIKLDMLPKSFWATVQRNANKRKISLEVSKEYCYELLKTQQYKCALSGVELYMAQNESEHIEGLTTASIDRIDSNLGYTENNIQWVHKDVNFMKHMFDQNYFLSLCKKIAIICRDDLLDERAEDF